MMMRKRERLSVDPSGATGTSKKTRRHGPELPKRQLAVPVQHFSSSNAKHWRLSHLPPTHYHSGIPPCQSLHGYLHEHKVAAASRLPPRPASPPPDAVLTEERILSSPPTAPLKRRWADDLHPWVPNPANLMVSFPPPSLSMTKDKEGGNDRCPLPRGLPQPHQIVSLQPLVVGTKTETQHGCQGDNRLRRRICRVHWDESVRVHRPKRPDHEAFLMFLHIKVLRYAKHFRTSEKLPDSIVDSLFESEEQIQAILIRPRPSGGRRYLPDPPSQDSVSLLKALIDTQSVAYRGTASDEFLGAIRFMGYKTMQYLESHGRRRRRRGDQRPRTIHGTPRSPLSLLCLSLPTPMPSLLVPPKPAENPIPLNRYKAFTPCSPGTSLDEFSALAIADGSNEDVRVHEILDDPGVDGDLNDSCHLLRASAPDAMVTTIVDGADPSVTPTVE